jgi:hypothetical protein
MTISQIEIHNVISGEIVRRDINETELAEAQADKAQAEKDAKAKTKSEQALADKRQIILDRLGLTADEFNALLG